VARQPEDAPAAAVELAERGAEVGWITLLSFASPERSARERIRERVGVERYLEIFVNTPPSLCREGSARDFYARSAAPTYEPPTGADLVVDPSREAVDELASRVVALLKARKFF
jgi:adenylylsulfate kinase